MAIGTKDPKNLSEKDFQDIVERNSAFAAATRQREEAAADPDAFQRTVDSGFSKDEQDRLGRISRGEEAPTPWKTNLNQNTGQKSAAQRLFAKFGKKAAKRWIIGGTIGAVFALGGSGALINLQFPHLGDMFDKKSNRFINKSTNTRQGKTREAMFNNPDECTGSKTTCRFHQGLNKNQVDSLRRVGLNPDLGTSSTGAVYVKTLSFTDSSGQSTTVNKSNFLAHWNSSPDLVNRLGDAWGKPMSVTTMGKNVLKYVIIKHRINKHNPLGTDPPDERAAAREFRKTLYGSDNLNARLTGIDEMDNAARAEAEKIVEDLKANNFDKPPLVTMPSLDDIGDTAAAVNLSNAGSFISNAARRTVMGPLSVVDSACTGYSALRGASVAAKIFGNLATIKYAMMFATIGSKLKAGSANSAEIGLLLNTAMTPSVKPASKGENFFGSEGFNLMAYGAIRNPQGLVRATNGGFVGGKLNDARQTINKMAGSAGINLKRDCGAVRSIWGQGLFLVVGGIITVASLGTSSIVGLVGAAGIEATFQVLMTFVGPMFMAFLAGTAALDITDPEGGYGMGNFVAAGWLAFASASGKANGLRPMKRGEYQRAQQIAYEHEAFMARAENKGKNPFDLSNPESIANKLVLATLPYTSNPTRTLQNGSLAALNPLSLLSRAANPLLTANPVYAADEDPYGMEYCKDEDILAMGLATDAFCNILYWEEDNKLLDPKYSPEAVSAWMVNNNHVDVENGEPRSQEFRNFMADCVIDDTPLLEDGGGQHIDDQTNSAGGTINTVQCREPGERETYFNRYIQDTGLLEADKQGANGTFGKEASV